MQHQGNGTKRSPVRETSEQTFDDADWVDWDHWQAVEELQNFMNGLGDDAFTADANPAGDPGENGHRSRIARQIHRHGLEIDW